VAKRLSGSGCCWDGKWVRSRYGCIRWGRDVRRGGAVLGMNLGRSIVTNGDFATRLFQITLGGTCYYWAACSILYYSLCAACVLDTWVTRAKTAQPTEMLLQTDSSRLRTLVLDWGSISPMERETSEGDIKSNQIYLLKRITCTCKK